MAVLLADIGGTNARFAMLTSGTIAEPEAFHVADFPRAEDAIGTYLASHRSADAIDRAAIAVAGPVNGQRCTFTNSPWIVDAAAIAAAFGFRETRVVNDFEALAWSLPHLGARDLRRLGSDEPRSDGPMVVLGPGTGLGVGALIRGPDGTIAVPTEGGHASLPAGDHREAAVIEHLRERFGHVSAERVLSGQGIENLYEAINDIDRIGAPPRDAPAITEAAVAGHCAASKTALDLFCGLLGEVAGNLALTFGARGGVFIGGGIVPRFVDYLAGSTFRQRFAAKGRFASYLAAIPVDVILRPDAAMLGLQTMANTAKRRR